MKVLLTAVTTGVDTNMGGPTGVIVKIMKGLSTEQRYRYSTVFSFLNYVSPEADAQVYKNRRFIFSINKFFSQFKWHKYLYFLVICIKFFFRLRHKLSLSRKEENLIIHAHDVMSSFIYLKFFKNHYRYRIITSIHCVGSFWKEYGRGENNFFTRFIKQCEEYAISNSDIITFPSRGAANLYKQDFSKEVRRKLESDIVHIVYNGIDYDFINNALSEQTQENLRKKYGLQDKQNIILTVASFRKSKGVDFIPNIAKALEGEADFFLVGKGELEGELKRQISELNLKNLLIIPPIDRKELINLMKISSVFLSPSRETVFDLVMLEAMSTVGPILLASDIPGHDEMIEDEKTGFLSKPAAIAQKIKFILNLNNAQINTIKENAKNRIVNNFLSQKMIENYEKIYLDFVKC
ncbi:MAG: glycosyltransferase family 4 protein [Patescibacteria group bacterium]